MFKNVDVPHLMFVFIFFLASQALAQVQCPKPPAAINEVSHDVRSSINASVGALGKIKLGDLGASMEVQAKSLFYKHPAFDRVLMLQTMTSIYCQALFLNKEIPEMERLERWEKFQYKILDIQKNRVH